jgi:predicted RNA binding protein with dsRBD fold (UPF0201 family)
MTIEELEKYLVKRGVRVESIVTAMVVTTNDIIKGREAIQDIHESIPIHFVASNKETAQDLYQKHYELSEKIRVQTEYIEKVRKELEERLEGASRIVNLIDQYAKQSKEELEKELSDFAENLLVEYIQPLIDTNKRKYFWSKDDASL